MRINISSVVVCDTEPIAMAGFRSLLESNGEFRVTAEETSLADAADAVRQLNPELLVVDKAFGIHRVMELVRVLRGSANRVRTVVWGINISEPEALRYLQTGAAGVVRKTAGLPALLQCLRTVATGATWMEESFLLE